MKLATLPAMLIGLVVVAQWPAYGEALTRGDAAWIRATFARTMRTSLALAAPLGLILLIWGDRIVELWAGPPVVPGLPLLVGMAAWSVVLVAGNVIAALLNGLHVVRFQVVSALLMATCNIGVSIVLVREIGVSGAIYGTLAAYVALTLIPYCYYLRRHVFGPHSRLREPDAA